MVKEGKHCTSVMKKHLNKELVMTKEDDNIFEISTKYLNCNNIFIESTFKVRGHCQITGKCKDTEHRNCNREL